MKPKEAYQAISGSLLSLQTSPPSVQLPDLRQQLIYYGRNGRPDAQASRVLLHFSIGGNKSMMSIHSGERLYLLYDKKTTPHHYVFSPNNAEASLWVEGTPHENEVLVKVTMKNEKGELVNEPEALAQFKLQEREFVRTSGMIWEIGGARVDGTLLARQKARWFGPDKFLERHGGSDFAHVANKQRVDFNDGDDAYFVFVGIGDSLIWDGTRWKNIMPGEESAKHPLLVLKKVDDRLMTWELWDVEGKGKVLMNVLKSTEPWMQQNAQSIVQQFKFIGARTRTQWVFEINRERMLVSPGDWLLYTTINRGWRKLSSEEDIDNYVKRKLQGPLFVFDGMTWQEGRQVMKGTLYNSSRSDSQSVEIPIQAASSRTNDAEPETPQVKDTLPVNGAPPPQSVKEALPVNGMPPGKDHHPAGGVSPMIKEKQIEQGPRS